MRDRSSVKRQIQVVMNEIQFLTRLLYVVADGETRSLALQQLWSQVSSLQFLLALADEEDAVVMASSVPPKQLETGRMAGELPTLTQEQLAAATGRSGNPAYVAVNGTVYDVTNNAAWSAATHFGLSAGRDLSAEFASCHADRPGILSTLIPVGRLA